MSLPITFFLLEAGQAPVRRARPPLRCRRPVVGSRGGRPTRHGHNVCRWRGRGCCPRPARVGRGRGLALLVVADGRGAVPRLHVGQHGPAQAALRVGEASAGLRVGPSAQHIMPQKHCPQTQSFQVTGPERFNKRLPNAMTLSSTRKYAVGNVCLLDGGCMRGPLLDGGGAHIELSELGNICFGPSCSCCAAQRVS